MTENPSNPARGPAASGEPEKPEPRRRRIWIFLLVISSILIGACLFACATWSHFRKVRGVPLWELLPIALTLGFILSMVLAWRDHSGLWLRLLYRICATWMGFLNFFFFAACGTWIFATLGGLLHAPARPEAIASLCFGAGLISAIYGFINAFRLRVTPLTVTLGNLPPAWRGRTLALVTDMHLGNMRGAGFTRRIVKLLQALDPAAVLIGGDMFDGVPCDVDALLAPWKELAANTWFVCGNHEEFGDRSRFIDAVRRAGIHVLDNGKVEIEGLQLVGIHDAESEDAAIYAALLRKAALNRDRASILLVHRPSSLAIPAAAGIALQLSGHTHGGQIWPWHLLARRVHGKFVHGLHPFGGMQVFTSYGAGTWGAPMRVRTKPEIVLIRLESSTGKNSGPRAADTSSVAR